MENLQLNRQNVCWSEKIKYLGVHIVHLEFNFFFNFGALPNFLHYITFYLEKLLQLMYQPGFESFMPLLMQYYIIQSVLMSYRVLVYENHLCCQY